AIEIKPERRGAEGLPAAQSAGLGHIAERALTRVLEQDILSDAGHQDVRIAVVVIISHRYSHAVHFDVEAGAARNIGECPVTVVAIQPQGAAFALMTGPVGTIDQENVLPAVAV